jgi:hypothetical protein
VGHIHIAGTATVALRTNFSFQHLTSAAFFAGEAAALESQRKTDEVRTHYLAASTSAVILSACAVEAYLNEIHIEASDKWLHRLGLLAPKADFLVAVWDTVERLPALRKYEWISALALGTSPSRGSSISQAAANLFELRDELVHAKPEWDHSPKRSKRLETRLKGQFPLSTMAAQNEAFLPFRCLGAGSSRWAVETAYAFVTSFSGSLQLEHSWSTTRATIDRLLTPKP